MKKNNRVNVILLLLPFVLGLTGCDFSRCADLLNKPSHFEIKSEVTDFDDRFDIIYKIKQNLKKVNKIEAETNTYGVEQDTIDKVRKESYSEITIFNNNNYESEEKATYFVKVSGRDMSIKKVTTKNNRIYHNNTVYDLICEETGFHKHYSFDLREMDIGEEELLAAPIEYDLIKPKLDTFRLFKDTRGRYHLIEEYKDYNIEFIGSYYHHYYENKYQHFLVNKKFQLVRIYEEHQIYEDDCADNVERPASRLKVMKEITNGKRFLYRRKRNMKNIDKRIDEFPLAVCSNEIKILATQNPYSNNQINTNINRTEFFNGDFKTNKDGSSGGTISIDKITIKKNNAVKLDLLYSVAKLNAKNGKQITSFSQNINLNRDNVDPLKYENINSAHYLIYAPNDVSARDEIYLKLSLLIKIEIYYLYGGMNIEVIVDITSFIISTR